MCGTVTIKVVNALLRSCTFKYLIAYINYLILTALILTTHTVIYEEMNPAMIEFCCFNASIGVATKTAQTCDEEITYADPTFYKRKAQKSVREFIPNLCDASLYKFSSESELVCDCFFFFTQHHIQFLYKS